MKIEEEVREKVNALLEKYERAVLRLRRREGTDAEYLEVFDSVAEELTRMAILGTLPAGCGPRDWSYKSTLKSETDEDFSEKKESFIAP